MYLKGLNGCLGPKKFGLVRSTELNTIDNIPPISSADASEQVLEGGPVGLQSVISYLWASIQSFSVQVLSIEGLFQLTTIVATALIAWVIAKSLQPALSPLLARVLSVGSTSDRTLEVVKKLIFPTVFVLLLWIAVTALRTVGLGNDLVRVAASLLQAWILVRLFSTLVRDPILAKVFSYVAWIIAALNILRLLHPAIAVLDTIALSIGDTRLSLYIAIKGVIVLVALLWAVSFVSNITRSKLAKSQSLTPSVQTLISQSIRIVLLFVAVTFAMSAVGVNLTALHVFSGAIGVGIGFGLQTLFSNLMAGIIILVEGTIKVGDFVELESGVLGEVREIDIRSTRIMTNDNVDILVPNAEFINNRVINWTLKDDFLRIHIPFGVAYGTDKKLVRKAALEAAGCQPHILTGANAKPSQVWLVGFGDSSLNFELVVWLSPAAVKRPGAVKADFNWALDDALSKYGIEIPFPQRDIRIRDGNFEDDSKSMPVQVT